MPDDADRDFPMIVLMLRKLRRVRVDEARRAVAAELGQETAATITDVGGHPLGMQYITWRHGTVGYNLGTSPEPYIRTFGVATSDEDGVFRHVKWTMREEVPPIDEAHADAWMSHSSWLYVDALTYWEPPAADAIHRRHVLRIASHFLDGSCTLLWLWSPEEPKRVVLPTPHAAASIRAGLWPG